MSDTDNILFQLQQKLKKESVIKFKVKIVPKSSRNKIVGYLGPDIIKIKIAAVAAQNKANRELVRYLGKILKIPASKISIKTGSTSPLKIIEIAI